MRYFIYSDIYFFYLFIDSHFSFLSMKPELEENQCLYAVKISLSIPNK